MSKWVDAGRETCRKNNPGETSLWGRGYRADFRPQAIEDLAYAEGAKAVWLRIVEV
jgi:hypothetical protein